MKRFLINLWEQTAEAFTERKGFVFLLFFFNYFTMAWHLALADDIYRAFAYGCVLLLFIVILAALLRRLLPPKWEDRARKALLAVSVVPFVVESFVMYTYKALLGAGVVNSILETNFKESVEFFRMYVTWREVASVIGAGVLLALLRRFFRGRSFPGGERGQHFLLAVIVAAGLFFAVPVFSTEAEFFFCELLPAERLVSATYTAVENAIAYHRLADRIHADIRLTENRSTIRNIVFILGESTNRNHMHLYGYYIPNTPRLEALRDKGELCAFSDVISPHSTTVAVLSELFTFCDYESDKPWYEYHNLIDIMNAAGYKTFWLSNQESSGIWGNVAQIYANHSSMHRFTRLRDSTEDQGILDDELFPLLEEAKAQASPDRNFYVLHLMGGHGLYYNRYPYSFHKFTADDIKLQVSERFRTIVAEYDNALYYNDHIVAEIIERFRDEETLVIYVPDHGEAVYDEGGSIAGHIEENPNRHMIEIPVVFWASQKFRENYPEKWDAIREAADRPYRTDDMIHTIMELADIRTEEWVPEKSVVNDDFDASRPRFFGEQNYDTEIRAQPS